MRIQHIAFVSEENGPSPSELARVAAAIQQQIVRHLAPLWGVTATVQPFPYLEDVPLGYWPVIVTGKELGPQAGIQRDENGQPFAQIYASDNWSLRASSACLEMLVNPSEDRVVVGPSPRNHGTLAEFLVEVCGPCDPERGYVLHGVVVSDFCTPAYFGLQLAWRGSYSVNGSATAPYQLGRFGHLAWRDPASGGWWLRSHWREDTIDTELGPIDRRVISVRAFIQACRAGFAMPVGMVWETRALQYEKAARVRAERLRALPASQLEPSLAPAYSQVHRARAQQELSVGPLPAEILSSQPRPGSQPPPLPESAAWHGHGHGAGYSKAPHVTTQMLYELPRERSLLPSDSAARRTPMPEPRRTPIFEPPAEPYLAETWKSLRTDRGVARVSALLVSSALLMGAATLSWVVLHRPAKEALPALAAPEHRLAQSTLTSVTPPAPTAVAVEAPAARPGPEARKASSAEVARAPKPRPRQSVQTNTAPPAPSAIDREIESLIDTRR